MKTTNAAKALLFGINASRPTIAIKELYAPITKSAPINAYLCAKDDGNIIAIFNSLKIREYNVK